MAEMRETILVVDDEELFGKTLSAAVVDLGYKVKRVPDFDTAKAELFQGLNPFLIFADRKVGGDHVEDRHLSDIKELWPEGKVIVYTRKDDLTAQQVQSIISRGAVRVLDRADIADSVDTLIEEFKELRELASALGELTASRESLVSALVGADVGVTVIDKEYACWYANRAQEELVGGPCAGGLCWNVFHGLPSEVGPCWACGVREVFKTEKPIHRVILTHLPDGSTRWLSVQCEPIRDKDGRVIAASEAASAHGEGLVRNMGVTERLFAVARGLVATGFGRVRLYLNSPGPGKMALVAAVSRNDMPDGRQYFESLQGLELSYEACPYTRKAINLKVGLYVDSWEEFGESPFKETLGLRPPYFAVPIWNDRGDKLIGMLATDFGDWPDNYREYAVRCLAKHETLRWLREDYGNEVRKALARRESGVESVSKETARRQAIAETARLRIGAAVSVDEAIAALRDAFAAILPGCLFSVHRKDGDSLIAEPRLNVPQGMTARETVSVDDPDSLAAYVLRTHHRPLWIDDYRSHREGRGVLSIPQGLSAEEIQSAAHLPLRFETAIYGTLGVDSREPIAWKKDGYAEPLITLADLTALVLREMAIQDDLQEAKAKTAALVAFAGTASKDSFWRHRAVQQLQALSSRASVLFSIAEGLKGKEDSGDNSEFIKELVSVAQAVDYATGLLKHEQPVADSDDAQCHWLPDLLSGVKTAFERRGVKFPAECPDCSISVTRYHFRRMVESLLDNALRECGGPKAHAVVEIRVALAGRLVNLDVIDNGPGIREDARQTILTGPVDSPSGGEGIGLLIVRGTALQFGGDLELISQAKPTHFRLSLPVAEQANVGAKA